MWHFQIHLMNNIQVAFLGTPATGYVQYQNVHPGNRMSPTFLCTHATPYVQHLYFKFDVYPGISLQNISRYTCHRICPTFIGDVTCDVICFHQPTLVLSPSYHEQVKCHFWPNIGKMGQANRFKFTEIIILHTQHHFPTPATLQKQVGCFNRRVVT